MGGPALPYYEQPGGATGIPEAYTPPKQSQTYGKFIRMGLRILSWKPTSLMADTETRGSVQQANLSVFRQIQNYIALLQEPARKFFRAGFLRFDRPFPLQGFPFERFKGCLHFFQPVSRKVRIFLCLIDDIVPVLAFVFKFRYRMYFLQLN